MAWIKQASILVAFVVAANAAQAEEARANRPVSFVLPKPVESVESAPSVLALPSAEAVVPQDVVPATPQGLWLQIVQKSSISLKFYPFRQRSMFRRCRPAMVPR